MAARAVLIFVCSGHAVVHVLLGLYLTLVLQIEQAWAMSYDELIGLWTLGALLVGVGAPLAGWLSDRWGERPLLVLFFALSGFAAIFCGLADSPTALWLGLALLGLAASIYHPVALSWVVRHTRRQGTVMGVWGVCGSLGIALASLVAGALAGQWDWPMAFIVPGVVSIGLGVGLAACPPVPEAAAVGDDLSANGGADSRRTMIRAFVVLSATLFAGAIFYHAFTTMLPKWLAISAFGGDGSDASLLEIGGVVTLVYLTGSTAQLAGGYLTDRLPLKWLYIATFALKLPLPFIAAWLGGWPAMLVAAAIVFFLDFSAPVENVLLARYSPPKRRGLIYGLKFVLAFAAAPLGVQLVALFYGASGRFDTLLVTMGALVVVMLLIALLLPGERRRVTAAPAPA